MADYFSSDDADTQPSSLEHQTNKDFAFIPVVALLDDELILYISFLTLGC